MTTFREKPVEVQAARWTGRNDVEMIVLLADKFSAYEGGAVWDDHAGWCPIPAGIWVIVLPGGELLTLSDDEFRARFEPKPEPILWVVGTSEAIDNLAGVYATEEAAKAAVATHPSYDSASITLDRAYPTDAGVLRPVMVPEWATAGIGKRTNRRYVRMGDRWSDGYQGWPLDTVLALEGSLKLEGKQ